MLDSIDDFIEAIEALVESQGEETYVALALEELGIDYVEDSPRDAWDWIELRSIALHEESI